MKAKRLWAPLVVLLLGAFVLMGAACQKLEKQNPLAVACDDMSKPENVQLCGYANYGTFVIFEEQAAKIAQDPALSEAARQAIVKADEVAKPVADNLYSALLQYEAVRGEIAAGRSTEDRLTVAVTNLNRWVTEAAPLITNLVNAVNTARGAK
jgi:hypothetical protein